MYYEEYIKPIVDNLQASDIIKRYIHISFDEDEKKNEYCACIYFRFNEKIFVIDYIYNEQEYTLLKEVFGDE